MVQADVATFDLDVVRRFADLAVDGLSASREEIDALNVYPVPDGDTGTNMFLTVESARDAMAAALEEHPDDLRLAMRAYARIECFQALTRHAYPEPRRGFHSPIGRKADAIVEYVNL